MHDHTSPRYRPQGDRLMKRLGLVLPVLALALALAAPAAAQQQPPTAPPTLSIYGLSYLGDPALQKELKLSEAQVKKLDELRDTLGRDVFLPRDPTQRDEANKVIDKS